MCYASVIVSQPSEPASVPELLDELDEFTRAVGVRNVSEEGRLWLRVGMLHCPKCGGPRRMDMGLLYRASPYDARPPVLAALGCGECDTVFTAVIYPGPEGPNLVVLPSTKGGLTTPHTPSGVAYYLDQAHRAHSIGANSAAVTMFRGALEHLLFEQGFKEGMCGKKLNDLEAAIKTGNAPKWAKELDTEFLKVMKELGDGSIHPNDGDVSKQAKLDSGLIRKVQHTFQMLLLIVYEMPLQKRDQLAALKSAIIRK